jgi:hypothetical protein
MPQSTTGRDPFFSILYPHQDVKLRVSISRLSVMNYAQGFSMWFYNASDAKRQDLYRPGYWDDARDIIAAGDMVLARTRMECGNYTMSQIFFPAGADQPFTMLANG